MRSIKISFVFFLYILIFTCLQPSISIAQNSAHTIIKSIKSDGTEIPAGHWNNIKMKPEQSLTLSYAADGLNADPSKIFFKIFVNGKIFETGSHTPLDKSVTLDHLIEGVYIVSIQAYSDRNLETEPAALKFEVIGKTTEIPVYQSDSKIQGYLLYGVILLCVIQLVIIFVFIKRRKKSETLHPQKDREIRSGNKEIEFSALSAEFNDLEYSYEKLKKEYNTLKELNDFLKQQVNSLKANISDLEKANAQLAIQKDKLLKKKRQLEELQVQKDELFAIAVHDIKNPASAIRGYVELLDSYDLNAQEQQEVMQSLVDTSSHIIDLAHQMALVVTKKKPEPTLSFETGSIKKIADSVCMRNLGYAIKKEIKLINQTSPNTPETSMDVSKIEEVLDNLVNNAIKYAPKETVVQVKSYFSGSKITVEVVDNGVGLSEEDCSNAFKKGVLLTPKPTDGETRSGLGLWIVKKIIEDHGGNVWVKSKLGVGSSFGFELPIKTK